MDRFNELVQLCLDDKASEEDVEEMFRLYREGQGDEERLRMAYNEIASRAVDYKMEGHREIVRSILDGRRQGRFVRGHVWMAAASIVIAVMAFGLWRYNEEGVQTEEIARTEDSYVREGNDFVRLPDGTTVTLHEGAKLTYSGDFSKREVRLTGQAFFDVAHDPAHPFRVHTGKIITTVLGTAFNINATSDKLVTVAVTRGKVSVGDDVHTYGTIVPNEQIAVNTATNEFVKSQVDARMVVQWKEDYFILDHVTIEEAVNLIEKRFGVDMIVENKEMYPCVISAYFTNNETLRQIVENISTVRQAEFSIADDVITIKGGKACE